MDLNFGQLNEDGELEIYGDIAAVSQATTGVVSTRYGDMVGHFVDLTMSTLQELSDGGITTRVRTHKPS
ncbi:hypothetical protein CLV78_12036 [Aliiruegeria haliotis]|uniref:Uncharacterized protein n=1 Tax=Aliiruegeria haliotis TaxID=1280846 RepID=A0A2T0REU0_9RHOB|nr:hypothetical protein CLV78_12036 [Aliiruegeria haliotis]